MTLDVVRDTLIEWGYHSPEVWNMTPLELRYTYEIGAARRAARVELDRQEARNRRT